MEVRIKEVQPSSIHYVSDIVETHIQSRIVICSSTDSDGVGIGRFSETVAAEQVHTSLTREGVNWAQDIFF